MPNHWSDPGKPLEYLWDSTIFGGKMFQTWTDLYIWERFLNIAKAQSLIELGTGNGSLSTWLAIQCYARKMAFLTIDKNMPNHFIAYDYGGEFRQLDIFANIQKIAEYIAKYPKPLILFCDNGNKVREFKTFAPLLSPGDFVIVHDWGSEIRPADINPYNDIIKPVDELATLLSQVTTFTVWLQRV